MAKILLVEDDTNLSEIYQARMEAEGYTVTSAADGESALAIAAKVKPDLIISDVMMPKISGFEMLDILRNTEGLKHTKVIMLTALGQAEDRTRAEGLGADKYLVKSQVTLEDIVSAAQELLGEASDPNAVPSPAELAVPVISTPATNSTASDSTDTGSAAQQPVQVAPFDPLPATIPVAVPAFTPVTDGIDDTTQPTPQPSLAVTPPAPTISVPSTTQSVAPTTEPVPVSTPELEAVPAPVSPDTPATSPAPVITPPASEPTEPSIPTNGAAPIPTPALQNSETTEAPQVAEPATSTPPAPAAPTPITAQPAVASAIDERVVADAIEKLLAKSPESIRQPGTPTANDAAMAPNANHTIEHQHGRIITPPEHSDAPSLQELLAKEEAKESGAPVETAPPPVMTEQTTPLPSVPSVPAAAAPHLDDEAQAAAILAQAQQSPALHEESPRDPTKPSTEFDPNSISL